MTAAAEVIVAIGRPAIGVERERGLGDYGELVGSYPNEEEEEEAAI